MRINFKIVAHVTGAILFLLGLFMLLPIVYELVVTSSGNIGIISSALITSVTGAIIWRITKNTNRDIGKREGYLIVVSAWVAAAMFSSLPYYLNTGISVTDAVFESVSGLTTTGSSIMPDIEVLSPSVLLWRSMTQWIGGMGIIVLTVALFPLLGIGGVELFVAESPGPISNKIHPRIKETAKRLWFLYVGLTFLLIVILALEGMSVFDAINHGLTTIATGGFSTKNASIAHFSSPLIQYTILLFMFVAGINYSLIYAGIKGRFTKVWSSDEFKTYVGFVFSAILFLTLAIYGFADEGLEKSFRQAAFQVVSVVTTTGYVSADYTAWHPTVTLFFFFLFFTGACAGSTAGGIKFIRHLVFAKNSFLEFKRLLHPNALIRLRIDKELVAPRILTHVLVFLLLYLLIFFVGTFTMSFILSSFESPLLSSAGIVATSLGNVGPAIGDLGPLDNFSQIPIAGKWLLCLIMLLGRLELFSVLILFMPYFWRVN